MKHFGDKGAIGGQHILGEVEGGFAKANDPQMVGLLMAGGRRRHITHHDIDRPAACRPQAVGDRRIGEIAKQHLDAGERFHFQDVDGDHAPAGGAFGANPADRDLRPTPWCGT